MTNVNFFLSHIYCVLVFGLAYKRFLEFIYLILGSGVLYTRRYSKLQEPYSRIGLFDMR